MAENEVKLILTADGRNLETNITKSGKTIDAFGRKAVSTFNRVGQTISHISDRYLTTFNALIGGAGIALAGKSVIDFDARLARLAIQAGLTKKEMFALKDQLFQIGDATHQMPTELLAAIEQIVEKTGNFKFAVNSLKAMGIVSSATGAVMEGVGATASNLQEKLGLTEKELFSAFDVLNLQGKEGAFTLKAMANYGNELWTTAASLNLTGLEGVRIWGAYLQMAQRGKGSAADATTGAKRTASDLIQNAAKIKELTGFSIFDPERSKKEGRHVLKRFDIIIKEIIKRTKGDITKLQKIFNEESIGAVLPIAQSFQKYGDFREFDRFIEMGGDGASTMKDFAFWSDQTASKIGDLKRNISRFANENLAGPIELLTKALDELNKHPVITKGGLWALLLFGGTLAGAKVFKEFKELYGMLKGIWGKGLPGMPKTGGLNLPGGEVVPVYVTNMPEGGLVPDVPMGKKKPSVPPWLGPAVGVGASVLLYGAITTAEKLRAHKLEMEQERAKNPYLSTLIPPPLYGTTPRMYTGEKSEVKNEINISLKVDKNDRMYAETKDMNTKVNLKRGDFLGKDYFK